jgi:hypothetical protein
MSEFAVTIAPKQFDEFFEQLTATGDVSGSARAARISRAYVYKLRSSDPAFAKRWEEAVGERADRIRDALFDEGVTGMPILDGNGQVVGRKRNPTILMRLGEKYGELDPARPTVAIQNNTNVTQGKLPPATTEDDYRAAMRQLALDVQAFEVDPDEDIL